MNKLPHNRRSNFWTLGDIARVQEWLGHANIATTRIYDRRKTKPEDRPTLKVAY
jgi:site-specific recombinase XerC